MRSVDARRPVAYLCIAGLLVLGSLMIGDPEPTGQPQAAEAASAPAGPPPPAPSCTEVQGSLRPDGPLPAAGAMPPGSTMARIAERGRLVAGVDQGNYLAGYRNPATGELEGSDIDIVRRIATAIFGDPGRVQYVVLAVADRVTAIERGQVNLVVNTFTVTCERQQRIEFSTEYLATSQRLLVPVGSGVREVEDLSGRPVCTARGSTNEAVLQDLQVEVVGLRSVADCVVELQRGGVSAVSSDDVILAGIAAQDPQTEVVGRSLDGSRSRFAVGMSRDAPDLVRFVNGVLEGARADGSLAASNQRWFGDRLDPVPQLPPAAYRD